MDCVKSDMTETGLMTEMTDGRSIWLMNAWCNTLVGLTPGDDDIH